MKRRSFLRGLAVSGALPGAIPDVLAALPLPAGPASAQSSGAVPVGELPALEGELTLYLGRGEGGLYENVLAAIEERNPGFTLNVRRGPTAALANAIVAEAEAGLSRADVFWAVDSGAIGLINAAGLARELPDDLIRQLRPGFRYPRWAPVTGRVRALPFNTDELTAERIPDDIMSLPGSGLALGWAPAYASFQSFVTAMRLLEGARATADWLRGVNESAVSYAGELGVVMAVERGEVQLGFANHYYTLRLKSGMPEARVAMAFTRGDAGCLVNASGVLALGGGELPINFIRYLLTREVQAYLANEAYEIPLVAGVAPPPGLPDLASISPPEIDLTRLADLRPTLNLMREAGVL